MDAKKISFGFTKVAKKAAIIPNKIEKEKKDEVELIKCLEGREIKLVEEYKKAEPITIPLKENGKTSAALASLMKRRAVLLGEDDEPTIDNQTIHTTETNLESLPKDILQKRAVLEILSEINKGNNEHESSNLVLPIVKPDELSLDGAKESTLDDYEKIPIEQYGLAMLRGMGWVQPLASKSNKLADETPMVRPKGMGLGADKALKPKPLLVEPEKNEKLEIKKLAYVRILGGKYKDAYGQIEGFDDEAGRVIVKMAIGGNKEAFNEFLCQPISKKEYAQHGKCINTAKYEEYKKLENEHGQIIVKDEKIKLKFTKIEKDDRKVYNMEHFEKQIDHNYEQKIYRQSNYRTKSNNSTREKYRSRSRSRSHKKISFREYHENDRARNGTSESLSSDNDSDSIYHEKSKRSTHHESKERKMYNSKKKYKRCSSSESSSNDNSDNRDHKHHKRDRHAKKKNKKNKKKTKKSKKQRSRTPTRHRK